jgi:uncharacterized protein (TIGR03000 family)
MFQKVLSFTGMLLLVGAAVLVTPVPSQAAGGGHGGGGHGGGGHGGGAHFGGGHFGGGHFGGAHFGGYRGGFYHGGYYSHPYAHYGYRHLYTNYGAYYPYYYNTYPYTWSSPTYDSGYSGSNGEVPASTVDDSAAVTPPASYQADYPPATDTSSQSDTIAHVTVNVPDGAKLWFNDTLTKSTGPVRQFYSPSLLPGDPYSYEVRARWNENGQEVTQTQKVAVAAGARVRVVFPLPPTTVRNAPAAKTN